MISYLDHRQDPQAWAESLSVSQRAVDLLLGAHFIDLHCDTEVPARLFGYDPELRHAKRKRPLIFFGHTDLPRIREASLTAVVYDIATNPWRRPSRRVALTVQNLDRAVRRFATQPEHFVVIRSRADYDQRGDRTAIWLSLQGGNALEADPSVLDGPMGDQLHRITLIHLTSSVFGGTSSPLGGDPGLTTAGRDFIQRCNERRVIVDLAHAGKKTFWDAIAHHSQDVPPIVSHTGIDAVRPHWRNLDDDQIRAIAERGGVIGIMYQSSFLDKKLLYCSRCRILDHMEHVMGLVGERFAAIGTDYDGMIVPPHDLPDVTSHPMLVQDMLDRGWSEPTIRGVLGENYLRVVAQVRPA